jgi:hypothetical protein
MKIKILKLLIMILLSITMISASVLLYRGELNEYIYLGILFNQTIIFIILNNKWEEKK